MPTSSLLLPAPAHTTRGRLQMVCLVLSFLGVAFLVATIQNSSFVRSIEQEKSLGTTTATTTPRVPVDLHSSSSSSSSSHSTLRSHGSIQGSSMHTRPSSSSSSSAAHHAHSPPPPPAPHRHHPAVVAVSWELPTRLAYRPNSPFHVGQRTVGALRELAARPTWAPALNDTALVGNQAREEAGGSGGGAQLVVRLPSADWGAELRPFTRLLTTMAVLLAMEEAQQAAGLGKRTSTEDLAWVFDQVHFLSPVSMFRPGEGSGGEVLSTAASAVLPPSFSLPVPQSSTGIVKDVDNTKYKQWTVDLRQQSVHDLFTHPLPKGSTGLEHVWPPPLSSSPSSSSSSPHALPPHVHDLGSLGGRKGEAVPPLWDLDRQDRAARLRHLALSLCRVNTTTTAAAATEDHSRPPPPVKVVVYNRDVSPRRLRRAHEVVAQLQALLPAHAQVLLLLHREDMPICEVVRHLADADALVTPHGFSSMLMAFLPRNSLLVVRRRFDSSRHFLSGDSSLPNPPTLLPTHVHPIQKTGNHALPFRLAHLRPPLAGL